MSDKLEVPPRAPEAVPPNRGRVRSLDGLRGLASLVVVVHHALLAVPVLAAPYFGSGPVPASHPFAWVLVHTPAHILWGGTEAVYVFFVLSGLVLTFPVLRSRFSWGAYYPARLVRLYVPVFAIVALGYASLYLVRRTPVDGLSEWLTDRAGIPTLSSALTDLTLLRGASGLISPLWSLQWEVLFSISLPLFIALASTGRRHSAVKALVLFACTLLGSLLEKPPLFYMPMFGIGVLLAFELDRVRHWCARLRRPAWVGVGGGSVLALSAYWIAMAVWPEAVILLRILKAVAVPGAVGVVLLAAFNSRSQRFFETPALQWLGTVSFSLYLVHEPIVVAMGFLLGPGVGWLVLPIALVVSLGAAYVFFRVVELPGHRLARACGARLANVRLRG